LKSWLTHAGAAPIPLSFSAPHVDAADRLPVYAGLQGEVLLEDCRVLVERFVLQPGESTGRQVRCGDQLLVFVKGGVLQSARTGRATLWRDGRVV